MNFCKCTYPTGHSSRLNMQFPFLPQWESFRHLLLSQQSWMGGGGGWLFPKTFWISKQERNKPRRINFCIVIWQICNLIWQSINHFKVHIMQLDHIRFAKSSFYFWQIICFSVFPAQFWIFSKWCLALSLGTLFTEIRQILAKFIFF